LLNIIRIKKASFYAYHGVLKEERNVGGKFEADIDLYTDFSKAASSDKLTQTIDYEKVYKLLSNLAMTQRFHLIEALANKIVEELFTNFDSVYKVEVRVRKNNPPIGGVADCVEVEVIKSRDELNK
jgi:dihydroneopterin aldolase